MSFKKRVEEEGKSMSEEASKAMKESKWGIKGAVSSAYQGFKAKLEQKREKERERRENYDTAYRSAQMREERNLAGRMAKHEAKQKFERMKQPKYSSPNSLFGGSMPGLGGVFSPQGGKKRKKGGGMFDML
jgi:hypothetical protein